MYKLLQKGKGNRGLGEGGDQVYHNFLTRKGPSKKVLRETIETVISTLPEGSPELIIFGQRGGTPLTRKKESFWEKKLGLLSVV